MTQITVFTRKDLLLRSQTKDLEEVTEKDLPKSKRDCWKADLVIVSDGKKAVIVKDRDDRFRHLSKDSRTLVNVRDLGGFLWNACER